MITDLKAIKVDDIIQVTHYIKVTAVTTKQGEYIVTGSDLDEDSLKTMHVQSNKLVSRCRTADLYEREEEMSQSDIIDKLMAAYNNVFTVQYTKKDGSLRELRGRLISYDGRRGYSLVEDLDNEKDDRIRQVDHRTLSYLIIDNVKYVARK